MDHPATEPAFEALLQRSHARLLSFARGLLGNEQRAHDVVQDVCVAAWRAAQRRAPPFNGDGDEAGIDRWLFRVAYNRGISGLRHERLLTWESLDRLPALRADTFYEPEPFEDRVAEGEVLHAALASLSPLDAACVLLNVVQGFRAWEIAQILEIGPEAAKKRIWRAKERLRAAYFAQEAPPRERARP